MMGRVGGPELPAPHGAPAEDVRAALLAAVVDCPATVELLALLADPASRLLALDGGHLVVSAGGGLAATVGSVATAALRDWLVSPGFAGEILLPADACASRDTFAPDWEADEARVLVLAGPSPPRPPVGAVVAPLPLAVSLDHLPGVLREEIEHARRQRPVQAAWVDGIPVSFAYCCWESPRHGDLSVDTLPAYRGRRLGEAVVLPVIEDLCARGKTPVWGALVDNHASLALAHRLGFRREAGRLWVLSRRSSRG